MAHGRVRTNWSADDSEVAVKRKPPLTTDYERYLERGRLTRAVVKAAIAWWEGDRPRLDLKLRRAIEDLKELDQCP